MGPGIGAASLDANCFRSGEVVLAPVDNSATTSEEEFGEDLSLTRQKTVTDDVLSTQQSRIHHHDQPSTPPLTPSRKHSSPVQPKHHHHEGRHHKQFTTPIFTPSLTTFDKNNPLATSSPFHGFYTLFWMSVFLFVVKIGADNWRQYGNVLGTHEIMTTMFASGREVVVLGVADGVMCALTGVGLHIQKEVILEKGVEWDGMGWVIQHAWQTGFMAGVVGFTVWREWPWTHTVFFVMHGVVMVMKMHSFGFYNGYLSGVWKRRERLRGRVEELEKGMVVEEGVSSSVSKMGDTGMAVRRQGRDSEGGDLEEINALKNEIESLTEELMGKATSPSRAYPNNLTVWNHYEYIVFPTVVYELEYPRSNKINVYYALEKLVACFGIIFVMIMISQAFIYPVVMQTVEMKAQNMPLAERFKQFPWMLLDLIFPFMMEYLLVWYLIWETILNFLAEITYFADRSFYDAWWNCVSWDQFARDWNRPVHNFLLRHVYHSSISAFKVNRHTATLITFGLSACVHELVMWCIFKKLRGYLLFLQMCQLPLVRLSRTRWLKNRATLGNMIFWLGIFTGPSVLCSLYLIL
ncbi:MBOAT, membrane-bound O-acyltransferase family-domain-containing protein [Apiosordaria backusii]|uniref:O-acyltransferase n=1 Tax=Apiosordaria backusii TaxID=314023 RepID=A0AA39ZQC5_9PEZI|nr:MBOAT, membrane-bound O-acyltransferase family-domain-containing protein [Apiosordaria backusii]